MKRAYRAAVILLILCLLFSFAYAAVESGHDCLDEAHCPICKIIAILSLFFGLISLPFLYCAIMRRVEERLPAEREDQISISPIDLKVKLLN